MKELNHIISQCIAGDRMSQKLLYDHSYTHLITAISLYTKDKTECDWVFNLGMLKVYKSLERYQRDTNYLAWARTILIRSAIDQHRKSRNYTQHLTPIVSEDIDVNISEYNEALDRLETESIIALVQQLSEKERLVFTMFEIDGYSHVEIESIAGINKNTSKWLLAKAKKELQKKALSFFNLKTKRYGK